MLVHVIGYTGTVTMSVARIFRGWVRGRGRITQDNGHYAVQGHSRSPIMVPMESTYATSYVCIIETTSLHVSKMWWIIGPIFAITRGCLCLTQSFLPQALNSLLQIWSSETRNVPIPRSISWTVVWLTSVTDGQRDGQTDRLWHNICYTSLDCAVKCSVAFCQPVFI